MSWDSDTEYTNHITLKSPEIEKILLKTMFFKSDWMLNEPYFDTRFLDSAHKVFKNTIGGAYFDPKFAKFLAKKLINDSDLGIKHKYLDDWHKDRVIEYYGEDVREAVENECFEDICQDRCGSEGEFFDLDSNDIFSIICHVSHERRGYIYWKHIESNMGGEPWDIGAAKYNATNSQWYFISREWRKFSSNIKECGKIESKNVHLFDVHANSFTFCQNRSIKLPNSVAERLVLSRSGGSYFVLPFENLQIDDIEKESFKWLCGNYTRSGEQIRCLEGAQAPEGDEIFWPPKILEKEKLKNFPIREFAIAAFSNKIVDIVQRNPEIESEKLAKIVKNEISSFELNPFLRLGLGVSDDDGHQYNSKRSIWIRNFAPFLSEISIPEQGSTESPLLKDGKLGGKWVKVDKNRSNSNTFLKKYLNIRRSFLKNL